MESIQDLAPEIQSRISGFTNFMKKERFSVPEVKNIGMLLHAMLKRPDVHVSELARSLREKITPSNQTGLRS